MSASDEGKLSRRVADDIGPRIPMPSGGPPTAVVVAAFCLLGVALFFFLEGRRRHATPLLTAPTAIGSQSLSSAPPLEVPPPPKVEPPPPEIKVVVRQAPAPPPIIQYIDRPAPPAPLASRPPQSFGPGSGTEPALVVDLGAGENGPREVVDEGAIRATVLRNPSTLIAQGTVIPAVLETPINSSQTGPVRALTIGEAKGFDGARVLIPRGSRLIGESNGDVRSGQSRVLVTWTRLIRPDGVTIRIGSPASDSLGGAGIAGRVNNHTLARFTNAVLQTALIAGSEAAARPSSGGVFVGLPSQAVTTTGQVFILPNSDSNHPTITIKAGAPITVFVAHDLDFAGTPRWP